MTASNRKLSIKRETRQISVDSSSLTPGKASKLFTVEQNELGFVRGVESHSDQVGFVRPREQSLPTDFSWDKLMPASWSRSELRWPGLKDWWCCRLSRVTALGVVAGLLIFSLSAAFDRVAYTAYSDEGMALLNGPEPMKAVAYFRRAADSESIQWSGAPRHLAALEGLAVAYERAGYKDSARESFEEAVRAAEKAPWQDRARMITLLNNYEDALERFQRRFEAAQINQRMQELRSKNDPTCLMLIFIVLGLAVYSLYAAHCLLESKVKLPNWRIYFWFTAMCYGAFFYSAFSVGLTVIQSLVFALLINYVLLPGLIYCLVVIGGSTAPYWHNALTSRKKSRK